MANVSSLSCFAFVLVTQATVDRPSYKMGSDSPFFKVARLQKTRMRVTKSLNQTPRIVSRMVLRGCHGHEEAIEQSSTLEIALEINFMFPHF